MKRFRVASILIAIALLLGGVACGDDDSDDAGGASISIGSQGAFLLSPVFVAQEKGFLAEHGVGEVETVNFTDVPAMMAAISRGQIDAALQTPSVAYSFNQQSQGSPLKFVAPVLGPTQAYVARSGSGIAPTTGGDWQATVNSLRGKTVGVPALGGLGERITRHLMHVAGLGDDDVSLVASGAGPAALAALRAGQVDAVVVDAVTTEQIVSAGAGEVVLDITHGQGPDVFQRSLYTGLLATEEQVQGDRETYAGLNDALAQARDWMQDPANAAELEQLLVRRGQLPAELARAVVQNDLLVFDVDMSDETLQRTIDLMSALGEITDEKPTPADFRADLGS